MKSLKLFFALFGLIIGLISFSSSFHFAQAKGGRWMYENNGNDESAWDVVENNGILSGAAQFSNIGTTIQGGFYLSLEDSASYGAFTAADQEELDFYNEDFAVSLWAFPTKGFDNPQHLLMKGDRSGNLKTNNYSLRINNQFLELIVHSESGANKVAKSSFKVVEYEWNFIAVFYDYNNSKLYLWNKNNSVPIDTLDFDAPLFPNDDKLYVGTSGENGFKRFWGRIDDVRISNKVSDIIDNITSIESKENKFLPPSFTLNQNYPNPFNPQTVIKFSLMEKGFTKLTIFNLLGAKIATLINSELDIGQHEINFNANNLSTGVYLYELRQGNHSQVKKMIFIK